MNSLLKPHNTRTNICFVWYIQNKTETRFPPIIARENLRVQNVLIKMAPFIHRGFPARFSLCRLWRFMIRCNYLIDYSASHLAHGPLAPFEFVFIRPILADYIHSLVSVSFARGMTAIDGISSGFCADIIMGVSLDI